MSESKRFGWRDEREKERESERERHTHAQINGQTNRVKGRQ